MFAHCLLPALLLLATVDYCVGDVPPYEVTEYKGRFTLALNPAPNFIIPDGQCKGILKKDMYEPCIPSQEIVIKVTVKDYVPYPKIEFPLHAHHRVIITRQQPCKGVALVQTESDCTPFHPDPDDTAY